jgi:hypothetical protein
VRFCLKLLREAMAEGLEHITGTRPVLFVDPVEIPLEKYLPFLKKLRPKTLPADWPQREP